MASGIIKNDSINISTTEKLIGTFNGKKLYEKIIYDGAVSGDFLSINVADMNIDAVIEPLGYLTSSTNIRLPLSNGYFNCYTNGSTYAIAINSGAGTITSACIGIRYIKT